MLEALKQKIEETLHDEIKKEVYRNHLMFIDKLVKKLTEEYSGFNADNLIMKLAEIAEINAKKDADLKIEFKKQLENITQQELKLYKQVTVEV